MSTGELREIPLSEVQQHSTIGSCWITLNDKVYDVSSFLSEHPGGFQVIAELAGQDATAAFEDVGHSKDAREMTKEYLIGKLEASSSTSAVKSDASTSAEQGCSISCALKKAKEIILSPTWSNFLIPTTIGIIIYVLYKGAVKALE
uniref:Cytochrome b5 domain containing protein n=1 Tax=Haemonchus contortus TaxID=6289 RepID=W6NC27_HAECO